MRHRDSVVSDQLRDLSSFQTQQDAQHITMQMSVLQRELTQERD